MNMDPALGCRVMPAVMALSLVLSASAVAQQVPDAPPQAPLEATPAGPSQSPKVEIDPEVQDPAAAKPTPQGPGAMAAEPLAPGQAAADASTKPAVSEASPQKEPEVVVEVERLPDDQATQPQPRSVSPPPAISAEPAAPGTVIETPARRSPTAVRFREKLRKVIYVRLAMGVGFPFGPDLSDGYAGREDGRLRFSGYSVAMDVMAGGTVLPWLVLGAGVVSDIFVDGTVRLDDDSDQDLSRSLYFAVVGAFADLYTAPPGGLHFQSLLGVARLSPSYDLGKDTATGFGAVLGVGYEVAVSSEWSVGALGRVALAPLSMDDVEGVKPSPVVYEPTLMLSASFRPGLGSAR